MSSKRCCASNCFNSQLNNKSGSVYYFGIPKYEEYAKKWLIAAGREDLAAKPQMKQIKYFLCSEHFEDHCFMPESKRAVLKKQINPLLIPVPTIFKPNIDNFVPKAVQEIPDNVQERKKRKRRPIVVEVIDIEKKPKVPKKMRILNKDVSQDNTDMREILWTVEVEDIDDSSRESTEEMSSCFTNICRLCGKTTKDNKDLKLFSIFTRQNIVDALNLIFSGAIKEDDGWPQEICNFCITKVTYCGHFISDFIKTQDKFMLMK